MSSRKFRRLHAERVKSFPEKLSLVPKEQWPPNHDPARIEAWLSRQYLVQIFQEKNGVKRLSVNRTIINNKGRWGDGISWEELQSIKSQVGLGSHYAVEIFPKEEDVVNVANMRHMWVLPEPLDIGWKKDQPAPPG